MNVDIVLVLPLGHEILIRTFLLANKNDRGCRWLWGQTPQREGLTQTWQWIDAGSPGSLLMDLDRNRLILDWALHAQRSMQCSKYWKRAEPEDTAPMWTSEVMFF